MADWRHNDGGMRRWWNYDPKRDSLLASLKKSSGNGSAAPAVLVVLEHSNTTLCNVHNHTECAGRPCTIHNRTDHHMRSFPQHWRSDRGIMERICPHGVGHPDPDSPWENDSHEWIHGCDGCCFDATMPKRVQK